MTQPKMFDPRKAIRNPVRVRYAETDQMGVVYHSNHFIWFEMGRVELLAPTRFFLHDMETKDGRFIAVVDVQVPLPAPVHYDDEIDGPHRAEARSRVGNALRLRTPIRLGDSNLWPKVRPFTWSRMRRCNGRDSEYLNVSELVPVNNIDHRGTEPRRNFRRWPA